jgi:hypothetical protein
LRQRKYKDFDSMEQASGWRSLLTTGSNPVRRSRLKR